MSILIAHLLYAALGVLALSALPDRSGFRVAAVPPGAGDGTLAWAAPFPAAARSLARMSRTTSGWDAQMLPGGVPAVAEAFSPVPDPGTALLRIPASTPRSMTSPSRE
jgi:hypothetical protein